MEKKSVIFLTPINEKLQKLKEVIRDDEIIDIYEIGDQAEAIQFIETLFPALWITNNPKDCLYFMAKVHRKMRKVQSKIVLFSETKLPPKALKKLEQLGVSNIIYEPIPPKSLAYKINLLVKSLRPKPKDTGDVKQKVESRTLTKDDKSKELRLEKMISIDEIVDDNEPQNKKNIDNLEIELEEPNKISNLLKINIEDDDNESSKKKNIDLDIEDSIKKEKNSLNLEIEESDSNKKSEFNLEIENVEKKKSSTILEIEDNEKIVNKLSSIKLDIEDDGQNKSTSNLEIFDNEKAKSIEQENKYEEEEDEKKPVHLDIFDEDEDDNKGSSDLNLVNREENEKQKKTSILLAEDEEKLKTNINLNIENTEEKRRNNHELNLIDEDEKDNKNSQLNIEQVDTKKYNNNREISVHNVDEDEREKINLEISDESIDKKSKTGLLVEQEESKKKKGENLNLIEEEAQQKSKNKLTVEESEGSSAKRTDGLNIVDEEEQSSQKNNGLNIVDEGEKTSSKSLNLKLDDEVTTSRKNSTLDLVEEELTREKERKLNILDEDDNTSSKDIGLKLTDDENSKLKNKEKLILFDDTENKKKSNLNLTENEMGHGLLLDRDEIINDDWDSIKKDVNEHMDFLSKRRKQEIALLLDENQWNKNQTEINNLKARLGEVTINYKTYEVTDSARDIDKTISEEDEYKGGKYFTKENNENIHPPATSKQDISEDEGTDQIFEVTPHGLQHIVQALDNMRLKDFETKEILNIFAEKIKDRANANTTFYFYDKDKDNLKILFDTITDLSNTDIDEAEKEELRKEMESELKEKKNHFLTYKLPTWSDEKFQANDQEFHFPYYEGLDFMGIAVIEIPQKINEFESKFYELLLEASRCVYLELYYKYGTKENYGEINKKQKNPIGNVIDFIQKTKTKTKSFFLSFFK